MSASIERKLCTASDGVEIVYSAAGNGEPGLVFVHGGLANRAFWDHQLQTFAPQHRVVAPDLPGHGESAADRPSWGLPQFGGDVRAVVEAEGLQRVIIFGNSLGGPVAIEAALLLGERTIGVVGIDTFQSLDYSPTPEQARQRAEAFRRDYAGALHEMVVSLLHRDADPSLVAEAERRMMSTSPEAAYAIFLSLGGYQTTAAARRLTVPLRAINGDIYPTDVVGVRRTCPDFEVVVMPHVGHYPMLERPEEFERHVRAVVKELSEPAA